MSLTPNLVVNRTSICNHIFQKYGKFLVIAAVLLVIFSGLAVWWPSPYYPDELAFRIGTARYIYDDYVHWGLYPFCTNSPRSVPWIFIPSAWLLSAIDMFFSPNQIRLLSSGGVLFSCFLVALIAASKNSLWSIALLSLTTIGVSGSGLVLVRGEHVLVIVISICLLAIRLGKSVCNTVHILILSCLTFAVITGMYIHPQGILFIPLIGCLATHNANLKSINKKIAAVVWICVPLLFIYGFNYHRHTCSNHPALVDYFNSMVFSFNKLQTVNFVSFMVQKFINYIDVFLYKEQYQVMYLPGIIFSEWFWMINKLIFIAVLCSLLINLTFLINNSLRIITNIISSRFRECETVCGVPLILSIAAWFLLIYDSNQYFYRTFFLHLIITLSNVLFLIFHKVHNFKFTRTVCLLCIGISISSTLVNYKHFFYRLSSWDAIATTPKNAVANPRYDEIDSVAKACGVDITRGRLIIDAYTYETVKHSKLLVDVYYARLIADVSNKGVSQVARELQIENVLASCKGMEDSKVGWPPEYKKNNICCSKLR